MHTISLSSLGMENNIWKLYRTDDPYLHEGKIQVPHMKRDCFETYLEGTVVTLGVYTYRDIEVLKAWGYKDAEHCSYHAIKINGTWSEVIEGCPDFKICKNDSGDITGISLLHKKLHIWKYDSYREEMSSGACCDNEVAVCQMIDKE